MCSYMKFARGYTLIGVIHVGIVLRKNVYMNQEQD